MKTPTDLALAALNGFKWLGNNLHNIRSLPDQFESFYKAALDDAEKAIAALSPALDPIAQGHNPDRLTVSHVGEGWRLLDENEGLTKHKKGAWWAAVEKWSKGSGEFKYPEYMVNGGGRDGGVWVSEPIRTRLTREELAALDNPSAPKAEPWDSPEDVPGPVCYVRRADNRERFGWAMVTGANTWGFTMLGRRFGDLETVEPIRTSWSQIGDFEHSTNRVMWKPCTKEAKA